MAPACYLVVWLRQALADTRPCTLRRREDL